MGSVSYLESRYPKVEIFWPLDLMDPTVVNEMEGETLRVDKRTWRPGFVVSTHVRPGEDVSEFGLRLDEVSL